MRKLFMKQKVLSLKERFTVKDSQEKDQYFVEGSFMQIPKTFKVTDASGRQIGEIVKKPISFLPKFFVQVGSKEVVIQKELTFLKARYQIHGERLSVEGDWLGKNFRVLQGRQQVATVTEKWLTWGDAYEIAILDERLEQLIVCFVIALDYVKESERAATSAGAN